MGRKSTKKGAGRGGRKTKPNKHMRKGIGRTEANERVEKVSKKGRLLNPFDRHSYSQVCLIWSLETKRRGQNSKEEGGTKRARSTGSKKGGKTIGGGEALVRGRERERERVGHKKKESRAGGGSKGWGEGGQEASKGEGRAKKEAKKRGTGLSKAGETDTKEGKGGKRERENRRRAE